MRGAMLFALLLVACGVDDGSQQESETDDMVRRIRGIPTGGAQPESWGQEKVFAPGELASAAAGGSVVMSLPPLPRWRTPRVQTLICGVKVTPDALGNDYHLRWILQSGTGGARTEVQFDAVGFTRVALPIEQARVSLAWDPFVEPGTTPGDTFSAFAYIGDFAVGELEPGPTYTEPFTLAAGAQVQYAIPQGASRFRMAGESNTVAALSPFKVSTIVTARNQPQPIATWNGYGAVATDPSLFDLHFSAGFIPLPGGTNILEVFNGAAAPITGRIIFGLDL